MNKRQIELWVKGRLFEVMNGMGAQDAKSVLTDLLDFLESNSECDYLMVETEVVDDSFGQQVGEVHAIRYDVQPEDNLEIGDKVKLIIIKED